ncbi:MAG: hypothetical protein HC819_20620 [Cyclobacteriaceae bacterium]|nr:hypothetical protein [Cyclobacteriaceae bacterium]
MRKWTIAIFFFLASAGLKAQDVGLSFSYFIPKNGDFSVPVTPFSIRGLGFDLNRFLAIESGFTLYRISGMGVKDLPYESKKPIIGPFFSLLVPAELVLTLSFGDQAIKLKGGGFAFYNFGTQINEGNMDRELRQYLNWEVLNSDMKVTNNPGFGYHFGGEYLIYFSKKFGISFEAYYLAGASPLDLKGSYRGVATDGAAITAGEVDFPDAQLDFSGYELSIGVLFAPK